MSTPDNSVEIYERLVAALDALPHGFPRTPSGVEMAEWEEMCLQNMAEKK